MFPSVSSSHVHPEFVLVPPEPRRLEPPRPPTPVAIHVSIEGGHAHAGHAPLHLFLPADYISIPSGKLHVDLLHPGLRIDEKGRRFISDGRYLYAIRFDRDHRTERVYQPDNPVKLGIPVRLNLHGEYERHHEVGLRGGSPGQDLTRRLTEAERNLDRAKAAKSEAQGEWTALSAEIRANGPNEALNHAKQAAERKRDDARATIAVEEGRIEALRREADVLRQATQDAIADKIAHRNEGRLLEQETQREITAIEAASNADGHAPADSQEHLRKLRDDLRRIQDANTSLDRLVLAMNRDLGELPRF